MITERKLTQYAVIFYLLVLITAWASPSLMDSANGSNRIKMTQPQPVNITVSAAASLKTSLLEIQQLYKASYPQVNLTFNFGSSGSLQQQIEQGAPIDLFISAGKKQMNALAAKKLIVDSSRKDLLRNQVVLIAPKLSTKVKDFSSLTDSEINMVALGEPNSVPAGKYSQEILNSLKIWDEISTKATFAKDVRQVLAWVETGNAEAGIVYFTDAKDSKQVKIVATASETLHSPVLYPMAVIKNSKQQKAATKLANYLHSNEATQVFKKYGFLVPTE